jgi:GxxExxY protein
MRGQFVCRFSRGPGYDAYHNLMDNFLYKDETYKIIGACFEVYREKGCGFLEPVYQECMEIESGIQGIPYIAKKSLRLQYKCRPLQHTYEPDLLCFDKVVVELKAVSALADEHRAQLLNYLNATGLEVGLLVNFGHYPGLEYERIVNTRKQAHAESLRQQGGLKASAEPTP